MKISKDSLGRDILPFVDIGADVPKVSQKTGVLTAKFVRDGREIKLEVNEDTGKVVLHKKGFPAKNIASFAALLASDDFANLRKWAESQSDLLRRTAVDGKKLLPVNGVTHKQQRITEISEIDALLGAKVKHEDAAEVLLIDGPAGIGKTNLVEQLALLRADGYRTSGKSLILHVRSRGRVLSNLQDLMAFSLQTLRSNTTYDQIPVLLKHGLIAVAVDGFDELGDPNGYELAWSQVNELIAAARGNGTVLLSGRDTFLGRGRLLRDVKSLREDYDVVTGLTLDSPTPAQAREWLKKRGWAEIHFEIPAISSLLENGSFALRPMFLNMMAEHLQPKKLKEDSESFLTPLLVQHMLQREAALFGANVDAVMSRADLENFLLRFLVEVSRDMADSQSEALDETTLAWLAEFSLGDEVLEEVSRLIQNRAGVIAALKPDARAGYRGFVHSHLQNYFLSLAILEAVGKGEIPKFLKRNILGSELIAVFGDVAAKVSEAQALRMRAFIDHAVNISSTYGGSDRAPRNIGGLLVSVLALLPDGQVIQDFDVDEAVIRGTAAQVSLNGISIHQLDCRGADLGLVEFDGCRVVNLISNSATRLSASFPVPKQIAVEGEGDLVNPNEVEDWLIRHGRNDSSTVAAGLALPVLKVHSIYKLLGRACRVRQYWLRLGDDLQADKILRDKYWDDLSDMLRTSGLLRVEIRQASGSKSRFHHIRMREGILSEDANDPDVVSLFQKLNDFAVGNPER